MTLLANRFSWGGFTVGAETDDLALLSLDGGLAGLSSPSRTTVLAERQGHGREPGSQWANERIITATLYTLDVATVLAFDATMAPRPDPTDELPWIGNFLGVGERLCWARPEACEWGLDEESSIGLWKITATWVCSNPTIYSSDESDLSWGGGGSPVPYADLTVTNEGSSTAERAWTLRVAAGSGGCTDPYIQIQGDSTRADESVRFTGLTMTAGQVLRVDLRHYATVGTLPVDGKARSRGQRIITWPELRPGTQTVRVGAITGNISGNFHHRSSWSV